MAINAFSSLFMTVSLYQTMGNGLLKSFHPETPDEKLLVSNSERRYFLSWQGNQGIARRRTSVRRTSKPAD
jgi:hypothetical protein